MDLSILVVSYNCAGDLRRCLDSVRSWTRGLSWEILVYDNASRDAQEVQALEGDGVTVVCGRENLGFGRANNELASRATGDYLLFLNPDTLLGSNLLPVLVEHLRKGPQVGAVAPALCNRDGSRQFSWNAGLGLVWDFAEGHYLQNLWRKWRERRWRRRFSEGPWNVDFASGACLCLSRELFQHLGGFDPDFFLNHEDIELCDRIRRDGLAVHVLPGERLTHLDGEVQKKDWSRFTYHRQISKWIYLRKRYRGLALLVARALWWEGLGLKAVVGSVVLRGTARTRLAGFAKAARDVLKGWR